MIQRVSSAIAGVVRFAAEAGRNRSLQTETRDVFHIGEVAGLFAIDVQESRRHFWTAYGDLGRGSMLFTLGNTSVAP
jgi:hypothetical protein